MRALDRLKREEFIKRCLGQTFSALVLQPSQEKGWSRALTENYLTVAIPGQLKKNERIRVCLTSWESNGLRGEYTF